ncbi:hypothetical protein KJ925_05035 [Patescibacteria group bacterium]|nr:hypothetical protein [Patescibacteria group bacterium]
MADQSLYEKTESTTMAPEDILWKQQDIATAPADRRITWANIKKYFLIHALAAAANDFLVASGAGVFVKKTLAEVKAILGLGTAAYTAATDYVTHVLAIAANDFLVASGAGVFVKKTLAETLTILGKAAASGLASLDASSLVVQNPANATATPTGSKIPIAGGDGRLHAWVTAIPQNSQSAAYTTVLSDAGKHILHPALDDIARVFTIDSNANVAYPIGTVITFVNQINTVTIAITTDTMTLAGLGTTGSRTLAANAMATALKVAPTAWIISGTSGLT